MDKSAQEQLLSLASSRLKRLDEAKLTTCGYKQELLRGLNFGSITGCTVSLASCLLFTEAYSLMGIPQHNLGPAVMIWGWLVGGAAMLCTAACVSELTSAYPTAGSLYFASFALAPSRLRTVLCWSTGWLNLAAQVLSTVVGEMTFVGLLMAVLNHAWGTEDGTGWQPSRALLVGCYAVSLMVHVALVCISQPATSAILTFGAFWSVVGVPAFLVALLVVAPVKQSASWVFTTWTQEMTTESSSPAQSGYALLAFGFLLGQWSLVRIGTGSHLCEETPGCDKTPSRATVCGVAVNAVLGLAVLVTLSFTLKSTGGLNTGGGSLMVQIVWDACRAKHGRRTGAAALLYMPLLSSFLCPLSGLVTGSRLVFAFSRDGALPGSTHWQSLNKQSIPVRATLLVALASFVLLGMSTVNIEVKHGLSCLMVMTTNISFLIPLALRATRHSFRFKLGVFSLGKWGAPMSGAACLWLIISTAVFCTMGPVQVHTVPSAAIMLFTILTCLAAAWLWPVHGASHSFAGPRPNLSTYRLVTAAASRMRGPPSHTVSGATSAATTSSPGVAAALTRGSTGFGGFPSQHTAELLSHSQTSLDLDSSHHYAHSSVPWAGGRNSYLVKLNDLERFSAALRHIDASMRASTSAGMDEAIEIFTTAMWEQVVGANGPVQRMGSVVGAGKPPAVPMRRRHSSLGQLSPPTSTIGSSSTPRETPVAARGSLLAHRLSGGSGAYVPQLTSPRVTLSRNKTGDISEMIIDEVDEALLATITHSDEHNTMEA